MSKQAIIDELSAVHWQLWRLHSLLERGSHRNCIATADDAVVCILRDLQDQPPAVRLAHSRGTRHE